MNLEIRYLHRDALPPGRAYDQAAAYDLAACLVTEGGRNYTITIPPHTTRRIPTGIALRPPPGHLVLCCSRSGLAMSSLFLANAPGVVDPDYTGDISALLFNGGFEPAFIKHHDRIMQVLVVPFHVFPLREVESFPETERGEKGFGSTGL